MTRLSVAVMAFVGAALLAGCKEEPTIVIKFEPNDLAGAAAAKSVDMTTAPAAAKPADLGVAATAKGTKKGDGKKAAAECKVAADCAIEPTDCCDCANGGKQHAIAKKVLAASKAARADRCKAQMCTMMLSTDPSCGQRADCVDGACVMTKK